jgi:hypothetical protein
MTTLREATESKHSLRTQLLQGMTVMFALVLAAVVTMFLVAVISVG